MSLIKSIIMFIDKMFELFAGNALMITNAELSKDSNHFLHSPDMRNCAVTYKHDRQWDKSLLHLCIII